MNKKTIVLVGAFILASGAFAVSAPVTYADVAAVESASVQRDNDIRKNVQHNQDALVREHKANMNQQTSIQQNQGALVREHKANMNQQTSIQQNQDAIVRLHKTDLDQQSTILDNTNSIKKMETSVKKIRDARIAAASSTTSYTDTKAVRSNTHSIESNSQAIKTNKDAIAKNAEEIKDNNEEAMRGVSQAMAMSAIKYDGIQEGHFSIGAGVGSYDDQTSVAVGTAYKVSDSLLVNAAVSGTDRDETFGYSTGVSYNF